VADNNVDGDEDASGARRSVGTKNEKLLSTKRAAGAPPSLHKPTNLTGVKADLFELLPDIVLFVAVARAKSFSRAAAALSMPVSTLSRRVADFESKLGVQLLVRSTRRVELTETGARYFEKCQLVVDTAESAQSELEGEALRPRGNLRVSATQDFALTYLTPIFGELAARYPEITFDFDLTARAVDLIGEGFDIAIRMGPLPDSQLFARKLGSSRIALYAAPSYIERAGALKRPSDLAHHECLRIAGPVDTPARWTLSHGTRVEHVLVQGRFVANTMRFLVELATLGLGVAAVDERLAREPVASGRLVRVLPDWSPPSVLVHAVTPSKLLLARARIFLDCLSNHLNIDAG
jgi:DNA-binding transcriptional LysR family regulator